MKLPSAYQWPGFLVLLLVALAGVAVMLVLCGGSTSKPRRRFRRGQYSTTSNAKGQPSMTMRIANLSQ